MHYNFILFLINLLEARQKCMATVTIRLLATLLEGGGPNYLSSDYEQVFNFN